MRDSLSTIAQSTNLAQRDQATIWHPYTQMQTAKAPLAIVRGKGTLLFDEQENAYIDAISSWWVNAHGHSHPYIAEKVYEQLQQLEHVIFAGFTHAPAVELSERLLHMLPNNQARIFFSDNGSTAVEVAIKMAIQYFYNQDRGRAKLIAFEGAYHGDTFGAMSAGGGIGFYKAFKDQLFEVIHLPLPVPGKEAESLAAMDAALAEEDAYAFLFEPLVQGAAGMRMYSPEVLDQLMAKCREKGVICIADEVMTGFGRTGKTFASDYLVHPPDIMCLSKCLTGGTLPLAITTCTTAIFDAFLSDDHRNTFFHGHSFTANPVGCAAALASMDLLERPECQQQLEWIAEQHGVFKKRLAHHPGLADIRQRGTILALEFQTKEESGYFNQLKAQLVDFFLARGVLLRPLGNVVYILPPYCIQADELQQVYEVLEAALDKFTA